ncbi:MAG TPA: diguanylate cyclase [Actinomycetes bacterium]|nr:diguanylate cyclase [Actinomycetes bacterium]
MESAEPLTAAPGERARLLVSVPASATTAGIDSRLLAIVVLLLVVVCLVATALGAVLARLVSQPLGELAEQARAIARGDFARPPTAVRSGGEVGELARAFERMRVELGQHLAALRTSRDELARSMNRLGETLSSTHDLPKLLAVVLEAAIQSRRARAASLLLLTADRTALVREATHGLRQRDPAERIPLGQGVAGTVAATGRPMVLASPAEAGPRSPAEPTATTQVSVPLLAQGRVLALLMLDLDHFKLVNDRYGHQCGDDVLVEFSRRVTGSVRDIDTFARYGGEEFVLVLPETNLEGGLAVAEKLRMAVHGTAFRGRGDEGMRLTVSIGVACFPQHATSREELLRAADEALYEAKLQGRDRVVTAGPRLLPLAARQGPLQGRAARVE